MVSITPVAPGSPGADEIVRAYLTDVASRWHGRPATAAEVDAALCDEPYEDLQDPTGVFLLALADVRPVGCTGVRFLDRTAELTKVFTRPEHRGRGLGTRLLAAAEERCHERGIDLLRLDTRAALPEACALYERNGFERVPAFNDDPYSDRWYAKYLGAPGSVGE